MNLLKLNCPSCGSTLELPEDLAVAHCIYCGNKILFDQDGITKEHRDLAHYIELCNVSVRAENRDETIKYCNLILEIDPKNIDAWINKAVATHYLTTPSDDRYEEALEYLDNASKIAPDESRIMEARSQITKRQSWWLNKLGNEQLDFATKAMNPYGTRAEAENASREYLVRSMNYFLRASDCDPLEITILENIAEVAKMATWISWPQKASAKIEILESLRKKKDAIEKLPRLKEELEKATVNLQSLQLQKGLFAGTKIRGAEQRISQIRSEIAVLQRDAGYDPTPSS